MDRSKLEVPCCEAYSRPSLIQVEGEVIGFIPPLVCLGNNDVTSPGQNKLDSPSMPVRPLGVGFGVVK